MTVLSHLAAGVLGICVGVVLSALILGIKCAGEAEDQNDLKRYVDQD